jgi:hypothetical protein
MVNVIWGSATMGLDIKSLGRHESYSCLEDAIVSFLSWVGFGYEMIFSDSWGFVY